MRLARASLPIPRCHSSPRCSACPGTSSDRKPARRHDPRWTAEILGDLRELLRPRLRLRYATLGGFLLHAQLQLLDLPRCPSAVGVSVMRDHAAGNRDSIPSARYALHRHQQIQVQPPQRPQRQSAFPTFGPSHWSSPPGGASGCHAAWPPSGCWFRRQQLPAAQSTRHRAGARYVLRSSPASHGGSARTKNSARWLYHPGVRPLWISHSHSTRPPTRFRLP